MLAEDLYMNKKQCDYHHHEGYTQTVADLRLLHSCFNI